MGKNQAVIYLDDRPKWDRWTELPKRKTIIVDAFSASIAETSSQIRPNSELNEAV